MHKHGQRKQIENLKLRIVTCVILERNENNEVVFEDSFNKRVTLNSKYTVLNPYLSKTFSIIGQS